MYYICFTARVKRIYPPGPAAVRLIYRAATKSRVIYRPPETFGRSQGLPSTAFAVRKG